MAETHSLYTMQQTMSSSSQTKQTKQHKQNKTPAKLQIQVKPQVLKSDGP